MESALVSTSAGDPIAVQPAYVLAAAPLSGNFTVTTKSSPVIYVDCSNGNDATYVAYNVTNNGAAVSDLWAQLTPAAGDIALSEDGIYHIGGLGSAASVTIYFFVKVNNCANKAVAQTLTVKLYTTPAPFGAAVSTDAFSYTVIDDVKASANKLDALAATPNPPTVGGLMTIDATGFSGNIGTNGIFAPTPASKSIWPADTFKLNRVTINVYNSPANITSCNFSVAPTLTLSDTLFVQNVGALSSGSTACYKIHYEFVIQKVEPGDTPISPLTWISSGNLQKHNDDYTGTAVILPPATPASTLSKTAAPTTATPSGTINYTLTVNNTASTAMILDSFQDTLPSGMTYVANSSQFNGAAIANPSISGQVQTWSGLFTVPATSSRSLTFSATLPPSVSCLSFTNSAFAIAGVERIDSTISTTDDVPATATVNGSCTANVGITKTDSVASINAGSAVSYTITVSNAGPGSANGSIFRDPVATGISVTGVTCGSAGGGAVCPTVPNTTVALMQGTGIVIPTLPNGGSLTFTVTANVTATNGSITNTATVDPPSGTTDPTTGNNSASDSDTVIPITDLAVTKTDGSATYTAGAAISYTITVTNAGPSNATSVSIADTVPASITGTTIGCTPGGTASCGTNGSSGNSVSYTNVSIAAGAGNSVTITVSGTVSAATTGNLVNTANVTAGSGQTDSNTSNNSATDSDTASPVANLAVTKSNGVNSVLAGAISTYTLTVSNAGPSDASGAIFENSISGVCDLLRC